MMEILRCQIGFDGETRQDVGSSLKSYDLQYEGFHSQYRVILVL